MHNANMSCTLRRVWESTKTLIAWFAGALVASLLFALTGAVALLLFIELMSVVAPWLQIPCIAWILLGSVVGMLLAWLGRCTTDSTGTADSAGTVFAMQPKVYRKACREAPPRLEVFSAVVLPLVLLLGILTIVWSVPALIILWLVAPENLQRAFQVATLLLSTGIGCVVYFVWHERITSPAALVGYFSGICTGPAAVVGFFF